jgi:hypothetical protein
LEYAEFALEKWQMKVKSQALKSQVGKGYSYQRQSFSEMNFC